MREAFGGFGSVEVQICVLITNLGCLIIYLIIIRDVLSGTEQHLGVLGRVLDVLKNWCERSISVTVVTDGERIFGTQ
ncbi:unnamed protein product [Linum tenue]|nr:unnamed protein product [Linum tenue]